MPVRSLVTEAIPEERPDDDDDSGLPGFRLDAEDNRAASGGPRPSGGS